ncbi:MAG: threonine synthase [Acidobacteria bacterium]|nr:threonine synthase [Acidobacteriota bacterium]
MPRVSSDRPSGHLRCIETSCAATYSLDDTRSECANCGNLLDVIYEHAADPEALKRLWRERKMSLDPRDLSGVWRFREIIPFLREQDQVVTLREGNTPIIESKHAAAYAGLDSIGFKHQGFNPTGSFKDNGMTAGVTKALNLGRKIVACVSTGNTSASLAAYASYGGLHAVIFIPAGQIAAGKLAQSLEYGAITIQVEANFDGTWKVVSQFVEQAGVYLMNSVNPYRIEGQKTIVVEIMERLNWEPPDWIVLPGGNLGNSSAFGKGLREMLEMGLIKRMPRLAIIQAEGSAPLHQLLCKARAEGRAPLSYPAPVVADPRTLATAIKIGAPVSWRKALRELESTNGVCESVSEQEIADAKAVIGQAGIGCEPASAASLAGARKLVAAGIIKPSERVIGVLTGNMLKDPMYSLAYHEGTLSTHDADGDRRIVPRFPNRPVVVPPDPAAIMKALESVRQRG